MCTNIIDSKPYLFIKKNYPVQSISVSISEFGFQNKTLNECILKDIFRNYFFFKEIRWIAPCILLGNRLNVHISASS